MRKKTERLGLVTGVRPADLWPGDVERQRAELDAFARQVEQRDTDEDPPVLLWSNPKHSRHKGA